MSLYLICVALHLLAMSLWLGHMFVWALIIGPALKRVEPRETAELLRERSLFRGGLGWPALAVLIPTGLYMLSVRGIMPVDLISGAAFHGPQGAVLAVKLACVLIMIAYQSVFSHRPAPIAIYFDMLAAMTILGASVLLVRGWI
jgi:putative copper export protein